MITKSELPPGLSSEKERLITTAAESKGEMKRDTSSEKAMMEYKNRAKPKSGSRDYNMVMQREYLIIKPNHLQPILATESVRSCCAILIYHPTRSAILHWDDNTCHSDIESFAIEFLKDDLALEDCRVHLIGGWHDYIESKKAGDFLKKYFAHSHLNLDHFQVKKSRGPLSSQGFSLVSLDARTGEVSVKENWHDKDYYSDSKSEDGWYHGSALPQRLIHKDLQDRIHAQNDAFPDSGAHIVPRDRFIKVQEVQSTELCVAAKNNRMDLIIQNIDTGITNVNVAPSLAKGCTPLHYACTYKNYEIARVLISNGADVNQRNNAGKTALDLIKDNPFMKKQLSIFHRYLQTMQKRDTQSFIDLSIFSRHPERFRSIQQHHLSKINELLKTEEGLAQINRFSS